MPVTKGYKQLLAEANAQITTRSIDEVKQRLASAPDSNEFAHWQLVDIRDPRELERDGCIPSALHAPRGMLEFWFDPESPYFKPIFGDESKEFVLYCGSAWRSALSVRTLQDMGLTNVSHMEGGFGGWKKSGGAIESYEDHVRAREQRPS